MTGKATNIKTKLKLFINNIDELDSTFVTYRALLIKDLFQLTLNFVQDKEQECEELKKNVEHWKMEHKEAKAKAEWTYDLVKKRLGKQLDQLKAENEELERVKDDFFKHAEISHEAVLNKNKIIDEQEKQLNQLKVGNEELKQTLTEIKEIAKNMNNECFYSDFDCKDCDMKNGCTYFNKKQILQKISECEVENN